MVKASEWFWKSPFCVWNKFGRIEKISNFFLLVGSSGGCLQKMSHISVYFYWSSIKRNLKIIFEAMFCFAKLKLLLFLKGSLTYDVRLIISTLGLFLPLIMELTGIDEDFHFQSCFVILFNPPISHDVIHKHPPGGDIFNYNNLKI